jgi:hypothetical protein
MRSMGLVVQPHTGWLGSLSHVRKRMRTNAHLAIRHDAYRFMPPGAPRYVGKDVVRYFWPDENVRRLQAAERKDSAVIAAEIDIVAERDELLRLKRELAAIKFELQLRRLLHDRKYSPNQPRVPAGIHCNGEPIFRAVSTIHS